MVHYLDMPQFIYSPTKILVFSKFVLYITLVTTSACRFCVYEFSEWLGDHVMKSMIYFVRNYHTVFQSGTTIIYSHKHFVNFCHSSRLAELSPCFNLQTMAYDVNHLLICVLFTCLSSLVRCLSKSLAHFLISCFSSCWVSVL